LALDTKYEQGNLTLGGSLYYKSIESAQHVDIKGVEVFAEGRLGARWQGTGSISFLHTDTHDSELYPFDLNFFFKSNLAYRSLNAWTIEANLLYRDGTPIENLAPEYFDGELLLYVPAVQDIGHLPNYFSLGLSLSKLFSVSDDMAVVVFASINNLTNHSNIRSYEYSYDYSSRTPSFFSLRTGYFGAVINF